MSKYHDATLIVSETDGARRERETHELEQQFAEPPVLPANRSLYQQLLAAGVELDNHESDLYVKVTPESTRILEEAGIAVDGHNASVFTSQTDGQQWYDLPFKYEPFWRAKMRAADNRHQPTVDIRHPMLEMGDKIGTLQDSVRGESVMVDDRVLGSLLQRLEQAYDALHRHLGANYLWD